MVDETEDRNVRVYLLAQLKEGSEYLENQKEALSRLWEGFRGKVVTFYETKPTKSVKKLASGWFERGGEGVQMVQRLSAQLYLPGESRYPVHSNHTDIVKFDSPRNKAFQTVLISMGDGIDTTDRKKFLKLLISSVKLLDVCFIDQGKYLENHSETPRLGLEQDGKYFWIFRNLDYEKWVQRHRESKILGLHGPSIEDLELAASHIVRSLRNPDTASQEGEVLLYFFYNSARGGCGPQNVAGWHDRLCVWNLLRQLDGGCSTAAGPLLQIFLETALHFLSDYELAELRAYDDPTDAFKSLLRLSKPRDLWVALLQVLVDLTKQENPNRPGKLNLTLIIDLNSMATAWKELIDNIREMTAGLPQGYTTVRVLLSNLPETSSLWQRRPSEILLEYDKERKECLKTLQNTRYEKISLHNEHTFQWLWESPEYSNWFSAKGSSLLFIEGKPGSGKSTLLRYFADHFNPPVNGAIVAKFFYSHRDGDLERNHKSMLQYLLSEILKKDESFFMHFQQEYRNFTGPLDQPPKVWEYKKLKAVLRACLKHPLKRSFFLIIDAMDESDDCDRADIVGFLQDLSMPAKPIENGCAVKIFLASRPINEIYHFSIPVGQRIRLQERNKGDIKNYTQHLLRKQIFSSYSDSKRGEIENYIIKHADGVFLWVRVVGDELESYCRKGASPSKMLAFLESLPRELEGYYEYILQGLDGNDEDDARDGRRILQFCLFSHRAVELLELWDALGIPGEIPTTSLDQTPMSWEDDKPGDIRSRLTNCAGSFVEIKSILGLHASVSVVQVDEQAIVQVMHQTVREFFLRPHKSVTTSHFQNNISAQPARKMIAITCIRYLDLHYRELGSKFQSTVGASVSSWSSEDIVGLVRYLNSRPLIKYSLEYLTLLRKDINVDPDVLKSFSILTTNLQNCPSSLQICLLERLTNFNPDTQRVQDLNCLLGSAAENGFGIAVGNLLAAGAQGETALHRATMGGHQATVRLLLDRGADVDAKDSTNQTPLHIAALGGHHATVRLLLDQGADIEAKAPFNRTPLHKAVLGGYQATVGLLLDGGADIEAKDSVNCTPLYIAISEGCEAMIRLLLDRGADIEANTPLHNAARDRYEVAVGLLLGRGAEIQAKGRGSQTPLHKAAQGGHEATIGLLLNRRADIDAKDSNNQTPNLHQLKTQKFFATGLLEQPDGIGSSEVRDNGQQQDQSGVPSYFVEGEANKRVKLDRKW